MDVSRPNHFACSCAGVIVRTWLQVTPEPGHGRAVANGRAQWQVSEMQAHGYYVSRHSQIHSPQCVCGQNSHYLVMI